MRNFKLHTLSACLGLIGCVGVAHGAGFQLLEQNASGLGVAYAGSAAIADNASTIYFNPAGMTRLPGLNISVGGNLIRPSFKFKNDGRSTIPTALGRSPYPHALGGTGGDAGGWALLPNMYVSYQATDRVYLGLGVGAPFGLKTEYDDDWMGRFHSKSFDIKTYNINPSIAFKASPTFSVGVGLNVQYIDATYRKSNVAPIGLHPLDGQPIFSNAESKSELTNTGFGWNVGFMYEPSENTRVGLSYRSRVKHKTSGKSHIQVMTPMGVAADMRVDAKATVSLPDTAILSGYHRLNDRWEILGDVSWTGWSSIPELTLRNATTPPQETKLDLKFKDSWRIAVGAQYQLNDSWKLKGGVAWDQSPVQKTSHRTASLPDNDRYWLSIGAQYKPSENTTLDVGYTYLIVPSSKVDNTNGNEALYGRLSGRYKANAHILGLQLSHRF